MNRVVKTLILVCTHAAALGAGFAFGIYALPILTAPASPAPEMIQATSDTAQFSATFRRDLADSDALHWGDGTLYIGGDSIAFDGRLAPGPDYRLYLSPEFVETEADFEALRSTMVQVGHVRTFENFMVDIPASVDPEAFTAAIVWCETFGQFITAGRYR